MIGTGIFATPRDIIVATGSVGASLILWVLGGIIALAGVHVWNELGLSLPRREDLEGTERSAPCSGGEKNYVCFLLLRVYADFANTSQFEYMIPEPRLLVTCMYGIAFLILGNLSGNAIQLGKFAMTAFGYDDPSKGAILGIAIAALTVAVVIHMFSRRGGILLNNVFAIFKVSLLVAMICMGIARKCGATFGRPQNEVKQTTNFENSFPGTPSSLANYSDSLLFVLYSYSGFKQPFYVLSEVETPRRIFPWATTTAVLIQWTLFVLINVAYLWVVDLSIIQENKEDMATLFFEALFGNDSPKPKRAMTGLLALSILGNIIVMTCEENYLLSFWTMLTTIIVTAARVKQEIAKEGILPWSLNLATSWTTPWSFVKERWLLHQRTQPDSELPTAGEGHESDQSPIPALALHWLSSVFLIAVTSHLSTQESFTFLISLYSYSINGIIGCLAAGGLLYLKYFRNQEWSKVSQLQLGPSRWTNSIPAWIYCLFTGFLVFTAFAPPTTTPQSESSIISILPWYVVPVIGMSSIFWGVIWYGGLKLVERSKGEILDVSREATLEEHEWPKARRGRRSEWVMVSEVIRRYWVPNLHLKEEDGGVTTD